MQVLYIPFFSWIFGLDVGDGIAALDLEGDGLSGTEIGRCFEIERPKMARGESGQRGPEPFFLFKTKERPGISFGPTCNADPEMSPSLVLGRAQFVGL
jgi:hypothetical protein